jgi:ATP-dependent DNA helicase RecG
MATKSKPAKSKPISNAAPTLGRLKSFGLTEFWHVALFLPTSWDDLTTVIDDFSTRIPSGSSCIIAGTLDGSPKTKFEHGKPPRLIGALRDTVGRKIGFSVFGDSREFLMDLKGNLGTVYLYGRIDVFDGRYWLKSPEVVQKKWIGRYRPRYPGKAGVINPDTVRDRVLRTLRQSIPIAAEFIAQELKMFGNREKLAEMAGLPGWPLERIRNTAPAHKEHWSTWLRWGLGDWRKRAGQISYALTDEQERAVQDALNDISSGTVMHRLLVADVGFGKSSVIGTVAASVVDGGGSVVVLLPNESLAGQIAREFGEWWPDLNIQLVTGSSGETTISAPLVIGTTALLFRDIRKPDLVIVDEQQKFSREQREQLVGAGTHLLESTATCIPRSMALARYGVVKVSKLTKPHTPKDIHTKIWSAEQSQELGRQVIETIKNGDQVLYVYPLRETDECEDEKPAGGHGRRGNELTSATEIFEKWEKIHPGKVRLIHGKMVDDEKTAALCDMREGRAAVLIATTVVEVGINLPKLRRVVIVHPDRHGLTTLHQIRGRVARLGGEGWCDLFLPYPLKEASMKRLQVLEETQDGFKVAEHDMRLRGVGDLSCNSSKQSGADGTFLFGRPVSIEALDAVMEMMEKES